MRHHLLCILGTGMLFWSGPAAFARQPTDNPTEDAPKVENKSDDEILRAAKIPTDGPGLVEFFQNRTKESADKGRLEALVLQLGDDSFQVRERASARFVEIGGRAKATLLEASKNPDPEIAYRARECLRRIELGATSAVISTAARMLVRQRPDGASAVLLAYLPAAEDESVTEDVRTLLTTLALRDGHADPVLVAALADEQPIKRSAAAEALCRAGAKEQMVAIRNLLHDPDARVRLRVGLALCALGDKDALPVLIDVLGELPSQDTIALEDLLYHLAVDKAPSGGDGTDANSRKRYRDDWKKWWESAGPGLESAKLAEASKPLGYTLVLLLDAGKAIELDSANRPRWTIEGLEYPLDVQALPGDHLLSAEYKGNRVTEREAKTGKVVWEYKVPYPLAAQRLPNGNTFIGAQNGVREVNREGNIVWEYTAPGGDTIMKANKLRNGDIAMVTQLGITRFVLLDRDSKTEKRSFPINLHTSGGRIDVLPNGNVIVPENANHRVVEIDGSGDHKIVWEVEVEQPVAAIRLPNGHTIITSMNPARGAVELDRSGKEIWTYKSDTRVTRAMRR